MKHSDTKGGFTRTRSPMLASKKRSNLASSRQEKLDESVLGPELGGATTTFEERTLWDLDQVHQGRRNQDVPHVVSFRERILEPGWGRTDM